MLAPYAWFSIYTTYFNSLKWLISKRQHVVSELSREAWVKKIVAFSFFGGLQSEHAKFRKYFKGIKDNMKLMKFFYPAHVMRVYVDFKSEK